MELRICLKFGCTLLELRKRMTRREFNLWWQYYNLEPWGSELAQLNTGIISATVANCRHGRGRGSKSYKYADFMPYDKANLKRRIVGQTAEEQIGMFKALIERNKMLGIQE